MSYTGDGGASLDAYTRMMYGHLPALKDQPKEPKSPKPTHKVEFLTMAEFEADVAIGKRFNNEA